MKEIEKTLKDKTLTRKQRAQCKRVLNHMANINKTELDAEKAYYSQLHGLAKAKYKAKKLFHKGEDLMHKGLHAKATYQKYK